MVGHSLKNIHNKRLQGSSVVEAVTASVIFLLIFSLALQAVVGMSMKEVKTCDFIRGEQAYKAALTECMEGVYTLGVHHADFEWGSMEIQLQKYGKTDELLKVSITLCMKNKAAKTIRCHVIKPLKINEI